MNFSLAISGQALTATSTSDDHALPDGAQYQTDLLIYNPGPFIVYARVGAAGVVATTASMPILPGEKGAYSKGDDTHIALYSPDGDQLVTVFVGEGS